MNRHATATLVLGLGLAAAAGAEPVVIDDGGGTRPITDYLPAVPEFPRVHPEDLTHLRPKGPPPAPKFPIRTPNLTPGLAPTRTVQLPQVAQRPLFLVGSDRFSRAWLSQHAQRLKALGAVGFLVQADTPREFEEIKAIAPGIPIVALHAGELARILDLTHYPVLVSSGRIEQ
jgi:integrating conjugative element protein (TIGR03765 family)